MSETTPESLARLKIPVEKKARRGIPWLALWIAIAVILLGGSAFLALRNKTPVPATPAQTPSSPSSPATPSAAAKSGDVVLTVSGYIIPRERIEISPKTVGTVKIINVKKGDRIKKGDLLVQLEDDEQHAKLLEAQGRLAMAEANLANAEANLKRQLDLAKVNVESERTKDDAVRARDSAAAEIIVAKGQIALTQTWLDWCIIRAPIDGTILEKLVDPNELVVPQSFGGSGGPSTAFVSMADLNDLQVEIDLNEADTPKVHLNQKCRVSPEAYPAKSYSGSVAEIAPEANRSKGTLQIKVQIEKPDHFLTPELSAKVEFLAD